MRPHLLCCTVTAVTFLLLCLIQPGTSQLLGCDAPGMECPTKSNHSGSGVCDYNDYGVGAVSFDSNITSEGPLTLTVTGDNFESNKPHIWKSYWLGTPPSLNLRETTAFGGCSMLFYNFTNQLQTQTDDFADFGCDTVMGQGCAQDIVARMRDVLLSTTNVTTESDVALRYPCENVRQTLQSEPLPDSCRKFPAADDFAFWRSTVLINGSDVSRPQEGCSISPGGSSYNMFQANYDQTEYLFPDGKRNSEEFELFKSGVTPMVTMFYNEPWNPDSTGPLEALIDAPEVHLTCLKTIPEPGQQSGAGSLRIGLSLARLAFGLGALFLTSIIV